MQPKKLGKYQLIQKINQGGMAEIYLARQRGLHGFEKIVAIKVVLPHLADDRDFIAMFSSEAKVAALLQHPNIVQIYDYGCENTIYFIAMEYIHGLNLNDLMHILIDAKREMSLDLKLFIIKSICAALDYAHSKTDLKGRPLNIVHRDVNPKNIMISYNGDVKLMDFGIALASNRDFHTSADGMIKGKLSYLSPEQVTSAKLDNRSDLFSLGIIFYELVTGKRPFQSESEFGVLKRIEEVQFKPPRELVPSIPEEIELIILRCLTRNRDLRYQTAGEIWQDIDAFEKKYLVQAQQIQFKNFLAEALGEKRINSPLIADDTIATSSIAPEPESGEESDSKTMSEDFFEKDTSPVPSIAGITSGTDSGKIRPEGSDVPGEGWETPSRWEKFRFPFIILLVLLLGTAGAFLFLGKESFENLFGQLIGHESIFASQLEIVTEPPDANVELDLKPIGKTRGMLPIQWQFQSMHTISARHPEYLPVSFTILTPSHKDGGLMLKAQPGDRVSLERVADGYRLHIKMIPEYTQVKIFSTPSGANIFVDGVDTKLKTPATFSFSNGKDSVVRIEKAGYAPVTAVFHPNPMEKIAPIKVTLAKIAEPTPTPRPKGFIRIVSPYPVDVFLNASRLGSNVTRKRFSVTVGTYKVTVKNTAKLLNITRTVRVEQNKTRTIQVEPPGTMIVDASPADCMVFVGDEQVGTAPGKIELAPGLYDVVFKWKNCDKEIRKWVRINSGGNTRVAHLKGCQ